ncbi:MAG: DUF4389 domain-containing protein [Gammaproteobacteria bacterium]|nr:DUF4389 domain-containing protein [Gammaproteobacteria bacterium]
MGDETDEKQLTNPTAGLGERAIYMLLFIISYSIAEVVVAAVIIFQFLHLLILRQQNQKLLRLGAELSRYIYQVLQFLNFNTNEKPFPVGDWPVE